jgi:hypothetical protein
MIRVPLALATAMACPAFAQTPAPAPVAPTIVPGQPLATIVAEPVAMMIAACDANGDAIVSRAELTACLARSYAAADPDRKGSIGYIGYAEWALKWLGDRNALPSPFEVDRDGDNRITLAELEARFDSIFARLDKDKDGNLTRAELLTIRSGFGGGDRPGGPGGKRGRK